MKKIIFVLIVVVLFTGFRHRERRAFFGGYDGPPAPGVRLESTDGFVLLESGGYLLLE